MQFNLDNYETLINICLIKFPHPLRIAPIISRPSKRFVPVNRTKTNNQQNILAAARKLYSKPSSNHPTMDDVSRAAGIGRATLYRHFKNRDDLLLTLMEQEALQLANRVEKKIRKYERPAEYVIEGMVQAWTEIRSNELLGSIFLSGSSATVSRLLFETDRLMDIAMGIMVPVVQRARDSGQLATDMDFDTLGEWILRILVSLITVPSRKLNSSAAVRDMLYATMLPVLEK